MKRGDDIGQPLWGTLATLNVFGGMAFLLIGGTSIGAHFFGQGTKPLGWWLTATTGILALSTTYLLTNRNIKPGAPMSFPPGWGPRETTEYKGRAIDHPDIEWEMTAIPRFKAGWGTVVTDWEWKVACEPMGRTMGGRLRGDEAYSSKRIALRTIENAAYSLLARPRVIGRTNPCVLCDQPSQVGALTCSSEHQQALRKAREELA